MEPARSEAGVGPVTDETLLSRTCEIPDVSFRAFLADRAPPRLHWAAPDGLEIVGSGAVATLVAAGDDRFASLKTGAAATFDSVDRTGPDETRPRFLGGLAFDPHHQGSPPWEDFPAASFSIPRVQVTRGADSTWLTARATAADATVEDLQETLEGLRTEVEALPKMRPSGGPPGIVDTTVTPSRAVWTEQVERALDHIRTGELRKVVLATALRVDLRQELDVPSVLERLRRTYPNCYRFLIEPGANGAFFGPPPERLVKLSGTHVSTEALAGSVPRGETPATDAEYAQSLLESEKLQHEQRLVVDAIVEQLAPYGTVTEGAQGVQKLTNIQHLQTPINATLAGDEHVLDLVDALHPTPAVGGVPPDRARGVIRETETFERGWYAGPVGWFDANGDGEFAVGIRSGVADGDTATLFAGNGIVADSDPAEEWQEVQHKYRPILDELEADG